MPVRSKKSKLPTAKDAKRDVQLHTLVMSAVPINTFAPEPYELRQPLLFVLQREGTPLSPASSMPTSTLPGTRKRKRFGI
jgi:hypothetical protein